MEKKAKKQTFEVGDTVRFFNGTLGYDIEGPITQIGGRGICEVTITGRRHGRSGQALPDKVYRPYLSRLELVKKSKKNQ
jgi:hypothetical protein